MHFRNCSKNGKLGPTKTITLERVFSYQHNSGSLHAIIYATNEGYVTIPVAELRRLAADLLASETRLAQSHEDRADDEEGR